MESGGSGGGIDEVEKARRGSGSSGGSSSSSSSHSNDLAGARTIALTIHGVAKGICVRIVGGD